jgi:Protein of unknown function (DUF5131)
MGDLFHAGVPDAYVHQVVDVMRAASWHTFQILTKRAERLASPPHPPGQALGEPYISTTLVSWLRSASSALAERSLVADHSNRPPFPQDPD